MAKKQTHFKAVAAAQVALVNLPNDDPRKAMAACYLFALAKKLDALEANAPEPEMVRMVCRNGFGFGPPEEGGKN